MTPFERLWVTPALELVVDDVIKFVEHAFETNSLTESMVVEFKARRHGPNIAEALGAFANTDGGLVVVGVDAGMPLGECMVGLTQSNVEALVDHLHQLMRDAMPEVIPLRLPASDLLLVLLRVRADELTQPVVVDGRVMLRFPGRSMAARREDVEGLVLRGARGSGGELLPGSSIVDPARLPLWPEDQQPEFVIRVYLAGRLPASVLEHLWLGSVSKAACANALMEGPTPDQVLVGFPRRARVSTRWEIETARSTFFGVTTAWTSPTDGLSNVSKTGSARVNLHGASLSVCLALGLRSASGSAADHLAIGDLYEALSGVAVSCCNAMNSVAASLSSVPLTERHVSAWLQPANPAPWVVDCGRLGGGVVTVNPHDAWLRPQALKIGSLDEVDGVVRTWLNLMLLDSGANDFEETIDHLRRHDWASGE